MAELAYSTGEGVRSFCAASPSLPLSLSHDRQRKEKEQQLQSAKVHLFSSSFPESVPPILGDVDGSLSGRRGRLRRHRGRRGHTGAGGPGGGGGRRGDRQPGGVIPPVLQQRVLLGPRGQDGGQHQAPPGERLLIGPSSSPGPSPDIPGGVDRQPPGSKKTEPTGILFFHILPWFFFLFLLFQIPPSHSENVQQPPSFSSSPGPISPQNQQGQPHQQLQAPFPPPPLELPSSSSSQKSPSSGKVPHRASISSASSPPPPPAAAAVPQSPLPSISPTLASTFNALVTIDPNWQSGKRSVRERNAVMCNNALVGAISFVYHSIAPKCRFPIRWRTSTSTSGRTWGRRGSSRRTSTCWQPAALSSTPCSTGAWRRREMSLR